MTLTGARAACRHGLHDRGSLLIFLIQSGELQVHPYRPRTRSTAILTRCRIRYAFEYPMPFRVPI